MLINQCPSILEREIEVRGLDEKTKTFEDVVEVIQTWARKAVNDRVSPGVNAVTGENPQEADQKPEEED